MDDSNQIDENLLTSAIFAHLNNDEWTSVDKLYHAVRKANTYPNFFKLKKNKRSFKSFCETLDGYRTDKFECSIQRDKKTIYLTIDDLQELDIAERTIHEICRDGDVDEFMNLTQGRFIYYEKQDNYGATILDAIDGNTDDGIKMLKFIIINNSYHYRELHIDATQRYWCIIMLSICCIVLITILLCGQK